MIRVLRVMEYQYPSLEAANADMANWQVPPTGDKKFGPTAPLIKSTVMLPQNVEGIASEVQTLKKLATAEDPTHTGWVSC